MTTSFPFEISKEVLGQGGQSIVFKGQLKEVPVAVKRVDHLNATSSEREEEALCQLKHLNIVRLLHIHDDSEFRYFCLELCVGTLEKYLIGEYKDIVLGRVDSLFQMARGLRYIHLKNYVHRDIKPENIMISLSKSWRFQLKISDFSLCKPLDKHLSRAVGSTKGIEMWLAPELMDEDVPQKRASKESDVFAMGCVFAYFLSGRKHPFGNDPWLITAQIVKGRYDLTILLGNPVAIIHTIESMIRFNDKARISMDQVCQELIQSRLLSNTELDPQDSNNVEHVTRTDGRTSDKPDSSSEASVAETDFGEGSSDQKVEELARKMEDTLVSPPAKKGSVMEDVPSKNAKRDLKMVMEEGIVLGKGFQSVVCKGFYRGAEVAIKRVLISATLLAAREEEALRKLDHPNVLRLYGIDQDEHFKYFALELCAGTIQDYCIGKYQGPMPSEYDALSQMTSGLHHIHGNQFIHRDIKPENILISIPSSANTANLKLSDFGVCKLVNPRGSASMSGVKGTYRWMAPELLPFLDQVYFGQRQCISTDVFALGCVFYYYLTRGLHPFGQEPWLIMARIAAGEYDLSGLSDYHLQGVIAGMIHVNPFQRTKLREVYACLTQAASYRPFVYAPT